MNSFFDECGSSHEKNIINMYQTLTHRKNYQNYYYFHSFIYINNSALY